MRDLKYIINTYIKNKWSTFKVQLTTFYKLTIVHSGQSGSSDLLEFVMCILYNLPELWYVALQRYPNDTKQ